MKFRRDIQILRGIAVSMVVLFHLGALGFVNGFLGVDVFFVISGYLMAQLYDRGSPLQFYIKRIDRLLPAYAFAVIGVVFASYFLLIPVDFSQLYEQSLAAIAFVNNFDFWNQNSYFDKAAFNPLLNLWSLSVEAQFYLIVPILYPFLRNKRLRLFVVFLATFAACVAVQTVSPKTSFFMMPLRIWEFVIGAYVAWYGETNGLKSASSKAFRILLPVLFAISLFVIPLKPDSTSVLWGHPSFVALWFVLLTGAMIYVGLPKRFEQSLAGRTLGIVGDYSYSIYLVHFPIIVLWNYKEFGGTILAPPDFNRLVGIILCITAAAYFSYEFVEQKFSALTKTAPFRVCSLVAILLFSSTAYHLNNEKFTDLQKNIFAAWTDRSTYRCGKLFRVLHPAKEACLIEGGGFKDSVLLVGNSHSDSIKISFAKAANDNEMNLFFLVSNDPLIGARLTSGKLADEVSELGVKYVAIHFSNIYGNPHHRSQLKDFMELLNGKGIKVLLIAPVPTYEVHIPQAMYLSKGDFKGISIDWAEHSRCVEDFTEFVKELNSSNLTIIDPAEVLCPNRGVCVFADSEWHPYYFDPDHLTLTGAKLLEPLFSQGLKALKN